MPDIDLNKWIEKGYRILLVGSRDTSKPRQLKLGFTNSGISLLIKYQDVAEFALFKAYPGDPIAIKGKKGNNDEDITCFADLAEIIDINNQNKTLTM